MPGRVAAWREPACYQPLPPCPAGWWSPWRRGNPPSDMGSRAGACEEGARMWLAAVWPPG